MHHEGGMETKYLYRIEGQVRGGKNNVLVLKNGRRIPPKIFQQWSKGAISEIKAQGLPKHPISKPCNIYITYYASDRRRRDTPALLDGIYHVLERAGVVKDDTLLGGDGKTEIFDNRGKSKEPHVEILIWDH